MVPLEASTPGNIRSEKSNGFDKNNVDSVSETATQKIHPFRRALPQVLATSVKNILTFIYGLTLGFPTIVIPNLMSLEDVTIINNATDEVRNITQSLAPVNHDPYQLQLTREQISWFGSINLISVPIGCILSGFLTQPFGRKPSMMAVNIPFIVAWLIYHYASTVWMLYAAVALTGLTGGLLEAPVRSFQQSISMHNTKVAIYISVLGTILTYVAEITTPQLRGMLSATSTMVVTFGVFVSFIFGSFMHWRTTALINIVVPIMAILALCAVPESPHWLIGKGRIEEAEKSLQWLRGWVEPSHVQAELSQLIKAIQSSSTPEKKRLRSWDPFLNKTFLRPFLLIFITFMVGHFCGMTTLQTFAVNIFADLGTPIDKYIATLILGLGQLIGTLVCVVSVHYSGKRPLAIISLLGCCVCFAVVAVFSKLQKTQYIEEYTWIPVVFLVLAAFMAHICIRLLPWILIGEVFPQDIRAVASGTSGSVGYICGFIANKSFFMIVDLVQLSGTFCLNALVSLLGAVYVYYQLPETESRSLIEIQEHFSGINRFDKKKTGLKEDWAR